MTIVVTGGGSGGHITPILAVAHALKQLQPDVKIVYIGQRGDKLSDIPAADPNIDEVYAVSAGKFRRYHGEGWWQLLDLKTQFLNIRDAFRVLAGTWQSYRLLKRLQPSVIFTRGGFVSVPVAFGGRFNRVPYITHDVDSVPSLANRLIAKGAAKHAVALPKEVYPYPPDKTQLVGVPLNEAYEFVTSAVMARYRTALKLDAYKHILFVTGGGNGADQLNKAVIANAGYLLKRYPGLCIVHLAGRGLEAAVNTAYDGELTPEARKRVQVKGFITNSYEYSGAADVIICRGGAINLAECAVQGKACILVPASHLVGGHQVKNAQVFANTGAILMFTEEQSEQEQRLGRAVGELLDNPRRRAELGTRLHAYAQENAAEQLAQLLLDEAKH